MTLSNTITTMPSLWASAAASSCPFIRKSPSPASATTVRSRSAIFAATAAGNPYPIGPDIGANCVLRTPYFQNRCAHTVKSRAPFVTIVSCRCRITCQRSSSPLSPPNRTWRLSPMSSTRSSTVSPIGIRIYFCDPHSPWQWSICENTSGLLRQYVLKRTDLPVLSQRRLDAIAMEMNMRPRKNFQVNCFPYPATPLCRFEISPQWCD